MKMLWKEVALKYDLGYSSMQNCLELQKLRWYSLQKTDVDEMIRNTISKMQKNDFQGTKKSKLFR
jgi:hypothetical protein